MSVIFSKRQKIPSNEVYSLKNQKNWAIPGSGRIIREQEGIIGTEAYLERMWSVCEIRPGLVQGQKDVNFCRIIKNNELLKKSYNA